MPVQTSAQSAYDWRAQPLPDPASVMVEQSTDSNVHATSSAVVGQAPKYPELTLPRIADVAAGSRSVRSRAVPKPIPEAAFWLEDPVVPDIPLPPSPSRPSLASAPSEQVVSTTSPRTDVILDRRFSSSGAGFGPEPLPLSDPLDLLEDSSVDPEVLSLRERLRAIVAPETIVDPGLPQRTGTAVRSRRGLNPARGWSRDQIAEVQWALFRLGYDVGSLNGYVNSILLQTSDEFAREHGWHPLYELYAVSFARLHALTLDGYDRDTAREEAKLAALKAARLKAERQRMFELEQRRQLEERQKLESWKRAREKGLLQQRQSLDILNGVRATQQQQQQHRLYQRMSAPADTPRAIIEVDRVSRPDNAMYSTPPMPSEIRNPIGYIEPLVPMMQEGIQRLPRQYSGVLIPETPSVTRLQPARPVHASTMRKNAPQSPVVRGQVIRLINPPSQASASSNPSVQLLRNEPTVATSGVNRAALSRPSHMPTIQVSPADPNLAVRPGVYDALSHADHSLISPMMQDDGIQNVPLGVELIPTQPVDVQASVAASPIRPSIPRPVAETMPSAVPTISEAPAVVALPQESFNLPDQSIRTDDALLSILPAELPPGTDLKQPLGGLQQGGDVDAARIKQPLIQSSNNVRLFSDQSGLSDTPETFGNADTDNLQPVQRIQNPSPSRSFPGEIILRDRTRSENPSYSNGLIRPLIRPSANSPQSSVTPEQRVISPQPRIAILTPHSSIRFASGPNSESVRVDQPDQRARAPAVAESNEIEPPETTDITATISPTDVPSNAESANQEQPEPAEKLAEKTIETPKQISPETVTKQTPIASASTQEPKTRTVSKTEKVPANESKPSTKQIDTTAQPNEAKIKEPAPETKTTEKTDTEKTDQPQLASLSSLIVPLPEDLSGRLKRPLIQEDITGQSTETQIEESAASWLKDALKLSLTSVYNLTDDGQGTLPAVSAAVDFRPFQKEPLKHLFLKSGLDSINDTDDEQDPELTYTVGYDDGDWAATYSNRGSLGFSGSELWQPAGLAEGTFKLTRNFKVVDSLMAPSFTDEEKMADCSVGLSLTPGDPQNYETILSLSCANKKLPFSTQNLPSWLVNPKENLGCKAAASVTVDDQIVPQGTVSLSCAVDPIKWKDTKFAPKFFESGAELECSPGARQQFDTEDEWQTRFELGCKYTLAKFLTLQGTAYYYPFEQEQQIDDPDYSYGFGVKLGNGGQFAVNYSNRTVNRYPWNDKETTTGRFEDGTFTAGYKLQF